MGNQQTGSEARALVMELAERHGGYLALAQRSGLSKDWARLAERGSVPRAATISKIAQAFAFDGPALDAALRDAKSFSYTTQAHRHHGMETIICPDCRCERQMKRMRLPTIQVRQGSDGRYYGRCHACAGRRNLAVGNLEVRDPRLIEAAVARIRGTWPNVSPGDMALVTWLRKTKIRPEGAWMLAEKDRGGDPEARSIIRMLRYEHMMRALGNGDLERGEQVRDEENRARSKMAASRPHPQQARSLVAKARLSGEIVRCQLCGLLVYCAASRPSSLRYAWHSPCWRWWWRSAVVVEWRRTHAPLMRRRVPNDMLPQFPMPPTLRSMRSAIEPKVLIDGYRMLIGNAADPSLSHRQLAAAYGVSEEAVRSRIKATAERLPAAWTLMFPGNRYAKTARQEVYPLPDKLKDVIPGRAKLAAHLADLAIPAGVIAEVTGYRVPELA